MASSTTRTRVTRRIAADPTSTALLLAGPAAVELWPQPASVRALPPRRTPTSYVTRFEWSGPGLPTTTAELTLAYVPGAAVPSTAAALLLHSPDPDGSRADAASLTTLAEEFLANLALTAERRASAA